MALFLSKSQTVYAKTVFEKTCNRVLRKIPLFFWGKLPLVLFVQGDPKMQDSDFMLKYVLEVRFNFSTCVSESEF